MTNDLDDILARCASATLPANVALMQAIFVAATQGEIDAALARHPPEGLDALAELWTRTGETAWHTVKQVAATADHAATATGSEVALARWRASFDRLAALTPEAGVALYALGDAALLAAVTAEVVDRLDAWGLLGSDRDALEIGCGSGRFVRALAPKLRHVTGTDLSAGMVAEARRRCVGLPNVRLEQTDGRSLTSLPDGGFDFILAADVFPYLTEGAGELAALHVAEAARLLRPGGDLVILNYSYRGDRTRDRAELTALAERHGFEIVRFAEGDFTLWDGATFHLRSA